MKEKRLHDHPLITLVNKLEEKLKNGGYRLDNNLKYYTPSQDHEQETGEYTINVSYVEGNFQQAEALAFALGTETLDGYYFSVDWYNGKENDIAIEAIADKYLEYLKPNDLGAVDIHFSHITMLATWINPMKAEAVLS